MSFNSIEFLLFLPIVIILYWVIPHKFRWILLLGSSYYFYMSWNPSLIVLIVGTTIVSYLGGIFIDRSSNKKTQKTIMIICVIICLVVLALFKYLDFLLKSIYSIVKLFAPTFNGDVLNLILPIGISFYTFQTLSYVIDVYRGTIKAEYHFGYYALFVSFFPQLVAGPIERPENLLPQLKEDHKICFENFNIGFRFLFSGFIKKVVIADFIGTLVDAAYFNYANANGLTLLLASILFFVQVYCDFSGYSDIATGAARMMGIKLMKNFGRPFRATSFQEQWSEWHISLNSWFKDYVSMPLNYAAMGSKHLKFRMYVNLFIVMILSGLWHGADWTFVLWGVSVGVFLTLERLITPRVRKFAKKKKINLKAPWYLWTKRVIMIILSGLVSVFFRASNISQAFEIFARIFTAFLSGGFSQVLVGFGAGVSEILLIVFVIALLCMMWRITEEKNNDYSLIDGKQAEKISLKILMYYLGIIVIALSWFMLISGDVESAFVYFQF